jgi:hypothetical protein
MPAVAPSSSASTLALGILLVALPFAACTRTIELVDLQTGAVLTGAHSLWNRSMSIALPAGETATGMYTKLTSAELGPDSLFFGANMGELLGRQTPDLVYGHAKLTGGRGTVVEIVFASNWIGHGHGVARTSLKKEYRVTF